MEFNCSVRFVISFSGIQYLLAFGNELCEGLVDSIELAIAIAVPTTCRITTNDSHSFQRQQQQHKASRL